MDKDSRVLPGIDALLAITDDALNKGLTRIFANTPDQINLELDSDFGSAFEATIAKPRINLLPNNQAEVHFKITGGEYRGPTKVDKKGHQHQEVTDLKDAEIRFTVNVSRMHRANAAIHETEYSIEGIYLDLTSVAAFDTKQSRLSVEAHEHIGDILNAFIEKIQEALDVGMGKTPDHLALGRIQVPAVVDAGNPTLVASHGAFSVNAQEQDGRTCGELNFLLMMGGRLLPSDIGMQKIEHLWTPRSEKDGSATRDGTLVISDALLLEAAARPILKDRLKIPLDLLALERPADGGQARLHITKPYDQENNIKLKKCDVTVEDKGFLRFALRFEKDERLQIPGLKIDLGLITVTLPRERTIEMDVATDDRGNLTFKLRRDVSEDLPAEFHHNLGVEKWQDIFKWAAAPIAVFLGPIAAGLTVAAEGVGQLIKSLTTDKDELNAVQSRFDALTSGMTETSIQLPGSAVLSFANPRFEGRLLCYDANYIAMPQLQTPASEPFCIPPFPRMGPEAKPTPDRTDPSLVGEAVVNYRMVRDPLFQGTQARDNPYYILSREQYWLRQYRKTFGVHETSDRVHWRIALSDYDRSSMEETANMHLTVSCRLAFKEYISAEASAEIAKELRLSVERTTQVEKETEYERTVNDQSRDVPYTEAVWTVVDLFRLLRADRSEVGRWEFVHGEDYVESDTSLVKDPGSQFEVAPLKLSDTEEASGN